MIRDSSFWITVSSFRHVSKADRLMSLLPICGVGSAAVLVPRLRGSLGVAMDHAYRLVPFDLLPDPIGQGWCYQHVQAITVAIDQYAEKALCNREYFLNKPYSIGGGRKDHVP